MIELKAVIFDYGNVLCESQEPEDLEALAAVFNLSRERFEQFYWRKRLPYDRSELTAEEYWDDFCRMAEVPLLSPPQREHAMTLDGESWAHVNSKMIAWVQQLRATGVKTAVLSNMPLPLREYLDRKYAWLREFDFRVFSCDVKMAKPEPAVYKLCLHGLKVAPGEALFLDDRLENIEGARRLGIHSLQFSTADKALTEIDGQYALAQLVP